MVEMGDMSVIAVGAWVNLATGDVPQKAQVTAVTIREGHKVSYEVVWWSGATRNTAWVEDCEIHGFVTGDVRCIGFTG